MRRAAKEEHYAHWRIGSGRNQDGLLDRQPAGRRASARQLSTLTPDVTVPQIVDFIGKFDVKALGIGSFGPLDLNPASPTYGSITKTPKKEWIQYPLMTTLKDALGVPTGIDTDVNAAALAEYTMGAGKGAAACCM